MDGDPFPSPVSTIIEPKPRHRSIKNLRDIRRSAAATTDNSASQDDSNRGREKKKEDKKRSGSLSVPRFLSIKINRKSSKGDSNLPSSTVEDTNAIPNYASESDSDASSTASQRKSRLALFKRHSKAKDNDSASLTTSINSDTESESEGQEQNTKKRRWRKKSQSKMARSESSEKLKQIISDKYNKSLEDLPRPDDSKKIPNLLPSGNSDDESVDSNISDPIASLKKTDELMQNKISPKTKESENIYEMIVLLDQVNSPQKMKNPSKKDEVEISDQLLQDYLALATAPENVTDTKAKSAPTGSMAASTAAVVAVEDIASSSNASKSGNTPEGAGDKSSVVATDKREEAVVDGVSTETVAATTLVAGSAFEFEKESNSNADASVVTLDEDMGGMTGSALFSSRDLSKYLSSSSDEENEPKNKGLSNDQLSQVLGGQMLSVGHIRKIEPFWFYNMIQYNIFCFLRVV